nr:hypothetical protein SHINE37_70254 [Rhizobiaceae bacterium]
MRRRCHVVRGLTVDGYPDVMSTPTISYKNHRFPPHIIAHSVWLRHPHSSDPRHGALEGRDRRNCLSLTESASSGLSQRPCGQYGRIVHLRLPPPCGGRCR